LTEAQNHQMMYLNCFWIVVVLNVIASLLFRFDVRAKINLSFSYSNKSLSPTAWSFNSNCNSSNHMVTYH